MSTLMSLLKHKGRGDNHAMNQTVVDRRLFIAYDIVIWLQVHYLYDYIENNSHGSDKEVST